MENFGSPALRRLLEFFPSAVEATHADLGDATARVAPGSLLEIMRLLRDEPGLDFEMLTDLTAVDYLGEEPRFELVYHLYSVKRNHRVRIKARVPEQDARDREPGLALALRGLDGARGLGPLRHPLPRAPRPAPDPACTRSSRAIRCARTIPRRSASRWWGRGTSRWRRDSRCRAASPRRRSTTTSSATSTSSTSCSTWGPSHPATHGTVKFLIELDGENIVDLDIQVGYLHRGFEKECESGTWYQAIPYTDRLNYNSAILANLGYVLAVEKLLGLELPERCQWLRTLGGELSRLGDHLTRCGAACLELAAMTPFLYGIEARELTWDLQEMLCGARVTSNYIRIGGVKHDLVPGFPEKCRDGIAKIRALLRDFDDVVTGNRIFVDRLRGTGVISKEDCLRYAVTGPILRSAGVPLDLRKQEPYLVYDQLDFDIPVGEVGDNYDRYLVCVEEMHQSLRIIEQCLVEAREAGPRPGEHASTRACAGRPRGACSTGWRS